MKEKNMTILLIEELKKTESYEIRKFIVSILVKIKEERAIEALIEMLNNKDSGLRYYGKKILMRYRKVLGENAIKALEFIIKNNEPGKEEALLILKELINYKLKNKADLSVILPLLGILRKYSMEETIENKLKEVTRDIVIFQKEEEIEMDSKNLEIIDMIMNDDNDQ